MKFLHLSDLHIGRRLYGHSLLDDQREALMRLASLAEECDAVLLAGDIYDRFSPSADAIRLASDFLVALGSTGKPIFAVSGNHDSAEQVAYCRGLLESRGVFISPSFDGKLCKYTLRDEHGEIDLILMPFIKPSTVRPFCPSVSSYEDAASFALGTVPLDPERRSVLVAHQFVTGAECCESEMISIGGLDQLSASLFDGFDYVALGHLHSPQSLKDGRVRYSGSPLKYSLSEALQRKCATIATLGAKGELSIETREIVPPHQMRLERSTLAELCAPENYSEDYVYATLTDQSTPLDPIGSLRAVYPNLLGMRLESMEISGDASYAELDSAESQAPLDHFISFYTAQHGGREPDEARIALMSEIIERAGVRARETDQA